MGAVAKYRSEHISLSVCLSVLEDISGTTRVIFTNFSVHVAYSRGLVLQQVTKYQGEWAVLGFFPLTMHFNAFAAKEIIQLPTRNVGQCPT